MKSLISSSLIFIFLFFSFPQVFADLCDDPLESQNTCYKMKSLRSQIDLIEAQRDLLQINYPFLKVIADDIRSLSQELQKDDGAGHLDSLKALEEEASLLANQAEQKLSESLVTANALRNQCLNCHSNANPTSGYKWTDISTNSWEKIIPNCNEVGKNPYLCKNMHGMKTVYAYFLNGINSGHKNFEATEETTREVKRIADNILSKNMTHGEDRYIKNISTAADEVIDMAKRRDPDAFAKAAGLSQSCLKCHGH